MSSAGDQLNLQTSDDPPVLLTVSRAALAMQSRVFADMLASGLHPDDKNESIPVIPVTETEAQLEVLYRIVKGENETAETVAKGLKEGEWEELAALADKYDCFSLRKCVEAKAWQVDAAKGSAAFAFTLATLLGNVALIQHTAKRAVLIEDLTSPEFHAADEWKDRLATWRTVHIGACLEQTRFMLRKPGSHGCSSKYCADDQISGCLETAWSSFDIRRSPPILSDKMFEGVSLCHIAENIVRERFKNLQAELSEWTEFPVTGLAFGAFKNSLSVARSA